MERTSEWIAIEGRKEEGEKDRNSGIRSKRRTGKRREKVAVE